MKQKFKKKAVAMLLKIRINLIKMYRNLDITKL